MFQVSTKFHQCFLMFSNVHLFTLLTTSFPSFLEKNDYTFHALVVLHCGTCVGIENYFKPHPQILCNGLKQTFEVLLLSTTSVTKKILIVKKYNSCCRSHLWWYDTASCIVEGIALLALEWTGWCRRCGTPEVIYYIGHIFPRALDKGHKKT